MKKDQQKPAPSAARGTTTAADHRVAQRHHKRSQVAQLSAANVEESPRMDRGDSAGGAGESLNQGTDPDKANEATRRGAVDTQYGTKSAAKTGKKVGESGRASSGGSGSSATADDGEKVPNPGSSEESSGAERDTMTGPRPGSGS